MSSTRAFGLTRTSKGFSLTRTLKVFKKDMAMGPRSPFFLYALVLPVAMTVILQLVFGTLFEPKPRLGLVDFGDSAVSAGARAIEGIELTFLDDVETLKRQVEANDLDVGLVLSADFDEAVRSGGKPPLELYIGGESLASTRIVLDVTALDLIRAVEGSVPPVVVELVHLGDAPSLPISARLVPLIMMYALLIAGIFVPASGLIEEKEKGTLTAMLVTPVRASEVVAAKALLGFVLAFVMSVVTLVLNNALGSRPLSLIVVVSVAAAFSALLGVVLGAAARSVTALFTIMKSSGIILIGPVIFYLFPEWPQWIAKLFPTYWMIDPIWQVALQGAGLGDVWVKVAIAVAIGVVLAAIAGVLAGRMAEQVAGE
ncbi:MAG: ABC transporter permease [Actinobacteria bacterium]|nr:ABC transporter permease [Actinomycetota bacterium]